MQIKDRLSQYSGIRDQHSLPRKGNLFLAEVHISQKYGEDHDTVHEYHHKWLEESVIQVKLVVQERSDVPSGKAI